MYYKIIGFPDASGVKNPPVNAGDAGDIRGLGSISGSEKSPGGGNGDHSSILAWRIPWTEGPGKLQSMLLQKSQTQLSD